METAGTTGFTLSKVHHRARHEDDPIHDARYPSGRELLRRAAAAGVDPTSWQFAVWANRPEQARLLESITMEHVAAMRSANRPTWRILPSWYQLCPTSAPVLAIPPTKFGIDCFDEDLDGRYRCPLGHVSGLNLLSEVWVQQGEWDGSDVVVTKDKVGVRRGILRPTALLLITQRLLNLFQEANVGI